MNLPRRHGDHGERIQIRILLLEESPYEIEEQTEDYRNDQHRDDWYIYAGVLAFVTDVARQASEPVQSAAVD